MGQREVLTVHALSVLSWRVGGMMQGCCMILGYLTTWKPMPTKQQGDPAYPLRVFFQGPFRNPHLTHLDGSIQQFNEFSKGVCRVVIWRYHKIFQVRGFQKESQDRNEQHWKDVHCLFVHFSNMLWVACMAIILQHFLTLSLPLCKTILLMCWRKENFFFLWKFIIWNYYDMQ